MFAMARLYQDGKMNRDAGVVYDYLMTQDTPTQDARVGAINVALAQNNVPRANELSRGSNTIMQTPDRSLVLASVAEGNGNRLEERRGGKEGRVWGLSDNQKKK